MFMLLFIVPKGEGIGADAFGNHERYLVLTIGCFDDIVLAVAIHADFTYRLAIDDDFDGGPAGSR